MKARGEGSRTRAPDGTVEKAVLVRMRKDEHRATKDAAKRAGITVAEWWRRAAHAALRAELAIWCDGPDIYVARDAQHALELARRRKGKRARKATVASFQPWPEDAVLTLMEGGQEVDLPMEEVVRREGGPGFVGSVAA